VALCGAAMTVVLVESANSHHAAIGVLALRPLG
jgi:hypothetical protein